MSDAEAVLDAYYAALKSGDREAIANVVSEDIVVRYPGPDGLLPWGGMWQGKSEFFKFLDAVAQHLDILEVNIQRREAFRSGVLVVLDGKWRVKATGREVVATVANIFDIADGKVTGYQVFNDTAAFAQGLNKEHG